MGYRAGSPDLPREVLMRYRAGSPNARAVEPADDFILGQWLDDLEVEHIRLFALNKP